MATKESTNRWDAYETSHKRDFIYRPITSDPTLLRSKTSVKTNRNSYTLNYPVNESTYSEDFYWKPAPKTVCIRSATASGNRRNNPHPSQAFMIWRHSADQMKRFDGSAPLQLSLTEQQIQNALSAQYRSTYRTDFQGIMKNHAGFAPFNWSQAVHYYTQTEMRQSYRPPNVKSELLGNNSRYGCNKLHGIAARGVVPTVVQSHIGNQETGRLQTTYNNHFGREHTDVSSQLNSVPSEAFQHFSKKLSDKERKAVKSLHITSSSAHGCKMKNTGVFIHTPSTLERTSAWPGPL